MLLQRDPRDGSGRSSRRVPGLSRPCARRDRAAQSAEAGLPRSFGYISLRRRDCAQRPRHRDHRASARTAGSSRQPQEPQSERASTRVTSTPSSRPAAPSCTRQGRRQRSCLRPVTHERLRIVARYRSRPARRSRMPRELRRHEGLSAREREVYELLIQGRTNREIAQDPVHQRVDNEGARASHLRETRRPHSRRSSPSTTRRPLAQRKPPTRYCGSAIGLCSTLSTDPNWNAGRTLAPCPSR